MCGLVWVSSLLEHCVLPEHSCFMYCIQRVLVFHLVGIPITCVLSIVSVYPCWHPIFGLSPDMGCHIGYPISDIPYIGPPYPISDIQYRIYPLSGFQTRYWISNIRYWILDISNIRCWVFALCMRTRSVCLYTFSLYHCSLCSMPSYIDTSHLSHGCGLWIWV